MHRVTGRQPAGRLKPLGLVVLLATLSPALPAQAPPFSPSAAAPDAPLTIAQLDQFTAPIALYPDALLGQILVAATYPLEVVEADRWLHDPANAVLRGNALGAALQRQSWDPSVKALVPFGTLLALMDSHLDWTELLGDTFLSEQSALMDSVQRLRQRAATAGTLVSTPQQNITTVGPDIEIEPANAADAYLPYYDPDTVYGSWPWPADPPIVFPFPAGIDVPPGTMIVGFGPAIPPLVPLGAWPQWRWRRHQLLVNSPGPTAFHTWHHNPSHRLGVPYRGPTVAARYEARSQAARAAMHLPRPGVGETPPWRKSVSRPPMTFAVPERTAAQPVHTPFAPARPMAPPGDHHTSRGYGHPSPAPRP